MANGTVVGVEYGGKPGLGRVVRSFHYRGADYVEVAPVQGGNLSKVFTVASVRQLKAKASA
jgi:hypothetical protein